MEEKNINNNANIIYFFTSSIPTTTMTTSTTSDNNNNYSKDAGSVTALGHWKWSMIGAPLSSTVVRRVRTVGSAGLFLLQPVVFIAILFSVTAMFPVLLCCLLWFLFAFGCCNWYCSALIQPRLRQEGAHCLLTSGS